jgi:hypothetical protein
MIRRAIRFVLALLTLLAVARVMHPPHPRVATTPAGCAAAAAIR